MGFLQWSLLHCSSLQRTNLTRLPFALSPLALGITLGYSYTKTFLLLLSHFLARFVPLSIAPVGAWIAIKGSFDWIPMLLGFIRFFSGQQDLTSFTPAKIFEFDRKKPVALSPRRASEFGGAFMALFRTSFDNGPQYSLGPCRATEPGCALPQSASVL